MARLADDDLLIDDGFDILLSQFNPQTNGASSTPVVRAQNAAQEDEARGLRLPAHEPRLQPALSSQLNHQQVLVRNEYARNPAHIFSPLEHVYITSDTLESPLICNNFPDRLSEKEFNDATKELHSLGSLTPVGQHTFNSMRILHHILGVSEDYSCLSISAAYASEISDDDVMICDSQKENDAQHGNGTLAGLRMTIVNDVQMHSEDHIAASTQTNKSLVRHGNSLLLRLSKLFHDAQVVFSGVNGNSLHQRDVDLLEWLLKVMTIMTQKVSSHEVPCAKDMEYEFENGNKTGDYIPECSCWQEVGIVNC